MPVWLRKVVMKCESELNPDRWQTCVTLSEDSRSRSDA